MIVQTDAFEASVCELESCADKEGSEDSEKWIRGSQVAGCGGEHREWLHAWCDVVHKSREVKQCEKCSSSTTSRDPKTSKAYVANFSAILRAHYKAVRRSRANVLAGFLVLMVSSKSKASILGASKGLGYLGPGNADIVDSHSSYDSSAIGTPCFHPPLDHHASLLCIQQHSQRLLFAPKHLHWPPTPHVIR